MQQIVGSGTVGSKLARANMKPANPRARPRNHETVTAARGGLACLLACLPLLDCLLLSGFSLSCGSARRSVGTPLVRGALARSVPDRTPLPMSNRPRRLLPALIELSACEPGTHLVRSHFPRPGEAYLVTSV